MKTNANSQKLTSKQRRQAKRLLTKPEMTCYRCNITSKLVSMRPNPYALEIHGDSKLHPMCDDCMFDMAEEI